MADKNPMNSFLDMFKDFGADLKLPTPEVDQILDHHRKNIQALQDAAQAASKGGQNLMVQQRDALEEALSGIAEMVQGAPEAAKNPSKLMSDPTELARKSFEMTLKNATDMQQIVSESGTETFNILRNRVEEGMSELTGGLLGKKNS